jgi:2-methylcitrate dehydratase PrpD
MSLTRELGDFVAGVCFEDLPPEAVQSIMTAFADTISVAVAGAREEAPHIVARALASRGDESTLFTGGRAAAVDAALVNGTAAHALDYDDVAQQGGHPSAPLVAAILAEAEVLGASGKQMLAAYAAGYEVFADLARRDQDQHHSKGWHPTGIFGALGAAAACASLRGLDGTRAATALGIAASQSSGLMANFGSMTKPFHAGRAAQSGVLSTRLAAEGFTASVDALEASPGFLAAVSPAGKVDLTSPTRAGRPWQICSSNRLAIKKYPVCFCSHRALDGMLDLLKAHPVRPADVEKVTVRLSRRNANILRSHQPRTGLEGKFSMEFAMASALVAGRAGLRELTDDFVQRPEVQSLVQRVQTEPDDNSDPKRPGFALHDQVTVHMRDGRILDSGPISNIRGDPELPLQRDEVWSKFEDCVQIGNPRLTPRPLFDMVMSLDHLPSARDLMRQLAG